MTRTRRPPSASGFTVRALACAALAAAFFVSATHAEDDWTEIVGGDPETGVVALTFDAGGVAGPAPLIIDLLRDRNVRATFFLSGQWVDAYPELARQVASDGHELANHSYSHPDLTRLSNDRIARELEHTEQVTRDATGSSTLPFFRPPFGARNARVLQVAADAGYRSVFWTLDSGDWVDGATAAQVRNRVSRLARPGSIVVHHVASDATARALPDILDEIEARGWRVGTVSEVLGRSWPPPDEQRGGRGEQREQV